MGHGYVIELRNGETSLDYIVVPREYTHYNPPLGTFWVKYEYNTVPKYDIVNELKTNIQATAATDTLKHAVFILNLIVSSDSFDEADNIHIYWD